jgi:hypothetical protein
MRNAERRTRRLRPPVFPQWNAQAAERNSRATNRNGRAPPRREAVPPRKGPLPPKRAADFPGNGPAPPRREAAPPRNGGAPPRKMRAPPPREANFRGNGRAIPRNGPCGKGGAVVSAICSLRLLEQSLRTNTCLFCHSAVQTLSWHSAQILRHGVICGRRCRCEPSFSHRG